MELLVMLSCNHSQWNPKIVKTKSLIIFIQLEILLILQKFPHFFFCSSWE